MEVEILLSIMNQRDEKQIEEQIKNMNIKNRITVINQITEDKIKETIKENGILRIYSYKEKGLSKSRNIAISKLKSSIGIIADDDVIYNENYEETIKKAYEKYQDADIIAFYVESGNPERLVRKQRTHKVNLFTAMRIQSVQITFRKGIEQQFDEDFGLGSKYKFGEENIWLYDCMKKGKKIYYINEKIAQVLQQTSTWYSKKDENFMQCEGAVFYRISKKFYWILILQYAIRKRKEYKENMSMIKAIKNLFLGAKEYKAYKSYNSQL